MFLRFSSISLRHCRRNLHSQYVSRTICSVDKVNSNSPLCGEISKRIVCSRYFCSKNEDVDADVKRITITFKKSNGVTVHRRGNIGDTIHDIVAQDDLVIPGFGVCGGTLSCSTCHVIFKDEDFEKPNEKPSEEELDLIDYAPDNCKTSRLSCCIKLTEEMDGMVLQVPAITKDQRETPFAKQEQE